MSSFFEFYLTFRLLQIRHLTFPSNKNAASGKILDDYACKTLFFRHKTKFSEIKAKFSGVLAKFRTVLAKSRSVLAKLSLTFFVSHVIM